MFIIQNVIRNERWEAETIRKAWNIISWVLVIAAAVLAFMLAGIRFIGFTPYTVLSGSMEPAFHVGSLIYVRSVNPENIKVGDAITFKMSEDMVATHRVIEIDAENQCFYTKGDANNTPDASPVHFTDLKGKAVFTIPKLGFFSNWVMSPPGSYIAMTAGGVLLLLILLPDMLFGTEEKKKSKQS
ncbi:MAG: signal peptidase I [Clostridiaceae bacterium]|nr:signal peptidase I [Clostridiaceae bacterium]